MFHSAFLLSLSMVRRSFIAQASTGKFPAIKVALCIQRYPTLSPEMSQLEKDYSNLITHLDTESSHLADHELRHKQEQELVKQKQNAPTGAASSVTIVETVVDLEDRLAKEFRGFQFMPRETDDDKNNNIRSHIRKLDQNLLLIVKQKNSKSKQDEWIFPEKLYQGETSLRAAVEQVSSSCGNLLIQISGNAPWACYKNDADPNAKKTFFYKAEYLAGTVKQFTSQKTAIYEDHAWITHEDLPKYLSPSYYEAVKDMLFVF